MDRWVMPYVEDSLLWPVLIVIVLHFVAFITPVLLMAIRDLRISALLAVAIMLYGTLRAITWDVRDRSGPGAITAILLITWVLSAIAAFYTHLRGWL